MEVIPIKSIREEDGPIIGNNLLNLAKLYQNGFPVDEGVVVTPPSIKFKTILEHFKFKDREIFEQSLTVVKNEVFKIPIPQELDEILLKRKVDPKKVWFNLLNVWFAQIRSKIWREGFSPKLTESLTSEPVFFTDNITATGEVYFDNEQNLAVVKIHSGKLTPDLMVQLDELTKRADKKLFLPQIYHFILDRSIKIVKLRPVTSTESEFTRFEPLKSFKNEDKRRGLDRSSIKVFLELGEDLVVAEDIDGILIKGEKITDFDNKVIQLVEAALKVPDSLVIFKLPDINDGFGAVRGTLKLIHGNLILKKEVEAFLFARHKKNLLNTHIAIPFTRSVQEFLQLKRDLAVLGVSRKGSLKLWFEIAAPENLLNIEDYLTAGFDGAILNLDELAAWLGGFDPIQPESIFYKKQVSALIKFLGDGLKTLHKAHVPVLALGKLSFHDDILIFLVNAGVWGISVDFSNVFGVHDHLRFVEKRNLRGKLN